MTPEVLSEVQPSAYMSRGKRSLVWTFSEPGTFNRCAYEHAWVEAIEQQPFRGEPVTITATRRRPGHWTREPFPTATHLVIASTAHRTIAGRFDTMWWRIWRAQPRNTDHDQLVDRLEARVEWWRQQEWVETMVARDEATVRPVDTRNHVVHPIVGGLDVIVAEIIADGERIGWVCAQHGSFIPLMEWPR